MEKCEWCKDNEIMEKYHDEEWGIPLHNDQKHFEYLMMEVMQCGLNWRMMLQKRETFRRCFDNFDFQKIAAYDEKKIDQILNTPDMIKSPRKVRAIISNAAAYQKIIEDYGSFDEFLWDHSDHKTIVYRDHQKNPVASNELSDTISKELKKRGFKYLGSVTVYSHLQACGMINDHQENCFLYEKILSKYPVQFREKEKFD